jgi:hypothetical protein
MRKLVTSVLVALAFAACDPTIRKFTVVPEKLPCPGPVTITWEGDADGGRLQADQPVSPALPPTVLKSGTKIENVTATTTFTFFYPSAAHREKTVTVTNASCGGGGTSCGVQTLTFTGTCFSSAQGPSYITLNVPAAGAPGNLANLMSDADFPVHVQHAGQDIALGAGGGPIFPLPAVPAAGDYTITVPGQVGQTVCADSGPTSGTTDAPVIHISVTPTCPP